MIMTAGRPHPPVRAGRALGRSLGLCAVFAVPALVLRAGALNRCRWPVTYGAVVAASFLLAWAAEAAQVDVSGGLAIAVLALIAVLPEYAVDLHCAYTAGRDPQYVQFAAANMTGSNRLLLGLGWPVVVLAALAAARRLGAGRAMALPLEPGNRLELGFLPVAGIVAFMIPLTGQIHLLLAVVLLAWFAFYLVRLTRGQAAEPGLAGTAAAHGRYRVGPITCRAAQNWIDCVQPRAQPTVRPDGRATPGGGT